MLLPLSVEAFDAAAGGEERRGGEHPRSAGYRSAGGQFLIIKTVKLGCRTDTHKKIIHTANFYCFFMKNKRVYVGKIDHPHF